MLQCVGLYIGGKNPRQAQVREQECCFNRLGNTWSEALDRSGVWR